MASDGRLWFNTKIDNSGVTKDLKELERQIKKSQESITRAENAKLPLVKNLEETQKLLDEAEKKLKRYQQRFSGLQAVAWSPKTKEDYQKATAEIPQARANVDNQKNVVDSLKKKWEEINKKVDKYDRAILQANTDIERATAKTAELNAQLATPNQVKVAQAMEKADKSAQRFGKRLLEIGKSALIFNLVSSGLRSVVRYMGTVLKTNSEYTAQLAQLKGALLTAFQPIYEFILPGLLAVLRVLTAIVQVVANVLSIFSGKTASQSAKNAQALNKQAEAISGVGNAAKEAEKQLMGFDEINRLQSDNTGSGGGGGGNVGTIKPDFSGITDMEEDLQDILDVVGAIAAGLLAWKIASNFTNSLSTAAGLGLAVGGAFLYAYNWADAFTKGIDWENLSGMLLGMIALAGGLALAFGPVGAAIGLLVTSVGLVVLAIKEWIETGELSNEACVAIVSGILGIGAAISLLIGNPIPLLIAAIVAFVIAAKEKGDEIKQIFANVVQWFRDTFLRDWTEVFGNDLGGQLNNYFLMCADILNGLEQMFGGLIDFIQAVFAGNWEAAWVGIVTVAKGAVNNVIAVINAMIRVVTDGINGLFRLLSFTIELPNGGNIGWTLPQFSAPQIPYLAQGAVLPANKPFLAMVGDQTNGTNVEAPLETIKQALSEVMAQQGWDVNVEFRGDLAALARILTPVITKEQRRASISGGR